MAFYPTIDYIGGMRGIADQLSAIPQDAMNYERMRQQAEEARSMQAYRALQMKKTQDDMEQTEKLRSAQAGFPAYLEQNKDLLAPGVGQRTVPDYSTAFDEYGVAGPGEKTETFATPAKKKVDELAIDYYLKNSPEYGIKLMEHKRDMDEKVAQHKMTMASSLLGKAITEGDTDMFNQLVSQYKKDPHLAPMFGDVSNMKLNSKKELETDSVRDVKSGEFTYPGTNDPVPPGKYDVKVVTKKDGSTVLKSIKPYEEKGDKFQDWGYGQKRDRVTGEIVKVPVNPAGDLTDMNRSLKELSIEEKKRKAREDELDRVSKADSDVNKIMNDPKNREGGGFRTEGKKLKQDALNAAKSRLNAVGKDIVEQEIPAESGGWFGTDVPARYNYRIVDKPVNPPMAPPGVKPVPGKRSSLSSIPLAVLQMEQQRRGLA
jgi:hypothetical protein